MILDINKKIYVIEGSNGVGKSSIINLLNEKYGIRVSKSVPEWFYQYIPMVRKLPSKQELKFYECAHISAFMEKKDNIAIVFDRSIYSTVIRIFYSDNKTVMETFAYIVQIDIHPKLAFILKTDRNTCKERLNNREVSGKFDEDFFAYENEVYDLMLKYMNNCIGIDATKNSISIAEEIYSFLNK